MMQPWQVWVAEYGIDDASQLLLIVSSEFHLRINVGRMCLAVPLGAGNEELRYRVPVRHPSDGETLWVHTDQLRLVTVPLSPTGWTLNDEEVGRVRSTLKHMVDL